MKNRHVLYIFLTVLILACSTDDAKLPAPIACFDYFSDPGLKTCTKISFSNCSEYALTYQWDFGDGNFSVDKNLVHEFDSSGTFIVKLIAKNETGIDSLKKELIIENYSDKYIHFNNYTYLLAKGSVAEYLINGAPVFKIILANGTIALSEDGNPSGEGEYIMVVGSGFFDTGTFDFYSPGITFLNTTQRIDLDGIPNGKIYIVKATNPVEIRIISNGVVAYYNGDVDLVSDIAGGD
jgi:PKD repeat protein